MIHIIKQTIEFYTKYKKTPSISDIQIDDPSLLQEKASLFVTLYKK